MCTDGLPTGFIFYLQSIRLLCLFIIWLKRILVVYLLIFYSKMSFKPYFNIIKSIVPRNNTKSRVLWNYIFFGYNPFTYATTFTSLFYYSSIMSSEKNAQKRVLIHCAAEVFIICIKLLQISTR